jgi:hypothetical protein
MRKSVFLFISIFSLFTIELGTTSGSTKLDKPMMVMDTIAIKTVKSEAVVDSLVWKNAEGTYYNPKDRSQTKKNPDGKGTSDRRIKSGSVALGSSLTRTFLNKQFIVYIQIKDCSLITPYGKGIFRVDDAMGTRFSNKDDKFFIDFYHKDVTFKQKQIGRFKIKFRVYKIITPDGKEISPSGFFITSRGLTPSFK